jgi:hypothetical protein
VRPHSDFHVDSRTEAVQDRHQSFHREPAEIGVPDARKVWRREARLGVGGAHWRFVTVQRLYDFRRQERLQLLAIGVLATKVAKYVPATANQLQSFAFQLRASSSRFDRSRGIEL